MSPAFDSPSEAMANTGRRPLFAMAALILVAATLLLGLAAPRLLGGIAQVPGEPIMAAVRQHLDVPLGDLRWAVQSRSTATEWLDSGDLWADAGQVELLLAAQPGQNLEQRQRWLVAAKNALRHAVTAAPANGGAWLRLAYVSFLLGERDNVRAPLAMSLATLPYEPGIAQTRIDLALSVWSRLTEADRAAIIRQVAQSAASDRAATEAVIRYRGLMGIMAPYLDGAPLPALAPKRLSPLG